MKLDGKKIMVLLIIFVLGCAGSVMGYIAITKNKEQVKKSYLPLEQPIMVNLKADKDDEKVLKMNITFEYTNKKGQEVITSELSKIQDAIINKCSDKTASQLSTSKQKEDFKKELKETINKSLNKEIITDILFTEFITN